MDVGGRAVREGMAADKIMRRVGGGWWWLFLIEGVNLASVEWLFDGADGQH
jgi:hypothetical protein